MGQVFAAYDEERGQTVALKVIGRITPQAIVQLKREFRTASELLHPNIVRFHELFRDGFEWFFTMDLVRGVLLPQLLARTDRGARAEMIRVLARQLAQALQAVHGFGAIHGDLKPSNFLVEDGQGEPRVVLLDFGLARPIGNVEGGGTLAYMAPEQILGEGSSEAIDWYSFGVVFHEALTGAIPRGGVVAASLDEAPLDLRDLCKALLRRRPEDRPTGATVLQMLGAPESSERGASPSTRPHIVGRREEIAQLQALRAEASSVAPSIVLVHGPSGIGKTALLEDMMQTEVLRGSIVLKGRCRENESIGYKAVDGVIDSLVSVLAEMSDVEVERVMPRSIADLVHLFPALRSVAAIADLVVEEQERGDQALVRQRAIVAFVDLLRNLGAFGPLVMWIDDLQWSDSESALILGPVLGGGDAVPLIFVGSYRTGDAASVPIVSALYADRTLSLPQAKEIALGPLNAADAAQMALEFLPATVPDAQETARSIGRDAAGLPLFIAELAHMWRTAVAPANDQGLTLDGIVSQRVLGLPAEARDVLELVAVSGAPIARTHLRQARRIGSADLEDAVGTLRASRLVLTKGLRDDHTIDVRHDRLREVVARGISDDKRKQHHLTLAVVLEANGGKPEEIATHYQAAGDLPRAGRFWLAAAEDSARTLAFLKAADFYSRALDRALLEPAERHRIQIRRAEMFGHAGEGKRAAQLYLAMTPECDPEEAIELRRRAAEQLLLSGLIQDGMRVIEDVLVATRMPRSRTGRGALPSVVLGRLRLRLRGLRFELRNETELSREELARLDVSWTLACSMGFVDFIRGADFQNRHLLLALRAGEPRRLARALALEALNTAAPASGSRRRTELLLRTSASLIENAPDRDTALGLISLVRGVSAYLHSDIEQAVLHCGHAVDTLTERCAGAVWERATAQRFLIAALFHAGEFRRLSELVPPLLAEAEGTANLYTKQFVRGGYSIASWLIRDEVSEARRQLALATDEWQSETYQLPEYNRLLSQIYIHLYAGETEQAVATLSEQWPEVERAQLLRIAIVRLQMWQLRAATAIAASAAATRRDDRAAAERHRAEARRSTAVLRRDRLKRAIPMAAMVDAAIDVATGARERADARLDEAAKAFDQQGMQLFAAAARLRLGQIRGGEEGRALVHEARERFRAQNVANPDRMAGILAPGFP